MQHEGPHPPPPLNLPLRVQALRQVLRIDRQSEPAPEAWRMHRQQWQPKTRRSVMTHQEH